MGAAGPADQHEYWVPDAHVHIWKIEAMLPKDKTAASSLSLYLV